MRRRQRILESRRRERAIQPDAAAHLAPAHVREQRRGPEQVEADPHIVECAGREIDDARRARAERRRSQRQIGLEPPVDEPRAAADRDDRAGQPLQLAVRDRRRRHPAVEAIESLARRQRQIGHAGARHIEQRAAVPRRPAPVAGDPQGQRPLRADQAADDAARCRSNVRADIEAVTIGLGIQRQPQTVGRSRRRGERHHRPALADIGGAGDPRGPIADPQAIDAQRPDANIEPGQDRATAAGAQLRPAMKRRRRRGHARDVEAIGDPRFGPPVQRDRRRLEHQALGIEHAHVAQHGLPVDRPLDPPDPETKAGPSLDPRDPVGQEAVARRGIDRPQREQDGDHQQNRQRDQPAPAPPTHRRLIAVIAQNACPSDT